MVSDSITPNASIPSAPKDFAKKKRANRSARLKQCKLDARREQWLSQGTGKSKGSQEQKMSPRASQPPLSPCKNKERKRNPLEKLETRRGVVGEEENENGTIHHHHLHHHHHDFDTDSPSSSPISNSSVLGVTDSGTNFTASSSCSGSSSGGSCSGNITEDEEEDGEEEGEEEDDNCLDDWEAMADALAANDDAKEEKSPNDDPHLGSGLPREHEPSIQSHCLGSNVNLRPECPRATPPRTMSCNTRAWRPDDAFRPQTLPNLAKQRSLPHTNRSYGHGGLAWAKSLNTPSSCPICCEDLDPTDSSFSPCTCGFRLCLFCHKRILEEDGRCPSCRKPYQQEHNKVEAEPCVHGGSLTLRLARSCSMRS
ncbi:unnamed protein product [Linum trigynum]|uniref:RING-type domain-containing protein n=1 Tax=Linum trigynum TaxID=586398 RepID=A0AAV2D7P5_9ROSI